MKKLLYSAAVIACAASLLSQSANAQNNSESYTYNLQRAYEVLQEDHDTDKAIELIDAQLQRTPNNSEAYFLRARVHAVMEEYGGAISDLNEALKYNKPKKSGLENSTLYWWKGTMYNAMENYTSAASSLQTALALARKDAKQNVQSISFALGQTYYNLKEYDKSDSVYKTMLLTDETDEAAMVGLARNMIEREEYQQAVEILNRAEALDDDYSELYRFRMQAYDKMNETDKAIDDALLWYEKEDNNGISLIINYLVKHKTYSLAKMKVAMNSSNKPSDWHALFESFYEYVGDYALALKEIDLLEQDYGKSETVYIHRSNCYSELGMTDLALAEIEKALKISDDAYNHGRKGDILRNAGRYAAALEEYNVVIDKLPDSAYGYYAAGWCYELSGDEAKALEYYDSGIDIDKDYSYIYLMRGEHLIKHGQEEDAKADFERILQIDTVAKSHSCRMYALHFLGKDDEAMEWMQKIISDNPYDSGVYYDKACLLSYIGKADEAVAAMKKSFELGYCSFEHIRHDNDLDLIRDRADFKDLMSKYEDMQKEKISKMNLPESASTQEEQLTEVPISRHHGGTFEVACEVNGLGLSMLFDTGASDVSISKVEADFMLKNKYLSESDIKGKNIYKTADGGLVEGTVITLKEVKIGDAVLHNVDASVIKKQDAPLLLGESVLQKFGTFTVDNINSKLVIKR